MFTFHKYQGTGNDFILVDNRNKVFPEGAPQALIERLCDRRFGIGADGLILLNLKEGFDFEMDYFNSDGGRSSMCGNGGRCITLFAKQLGIIQDNARFIAADGPHEAMLTSFGVKLKMGFPTGFLKINENDFWIQTGSPHFVRFIDSDLDGYDVKTEGKKLRSFGPWKKDGTNSNFVFVNEIQDLHVRSYERGVENETLSCGTGVTAAAEVFCRRNNIQEKIVIVRTPGGTLRVHVKIGSEPFLEGPAEFVFEGIWK